MLDSACRRPDMDDELNTATKYGLFWSRACIQDEDGKLLADGFYVYQPERFSATFFLLFDKLAQLNDYCFNQLISSETKLRELAAQRTTAIARNDVGAEELDYLDDQLPMWENNVSVVGKAVPIVLLCGFVEWGLKLVTKEFCGRVPRKSASRISDFEFLLHHLQQNSPLPLDITGDPILSIDSFRKVRNAFAHGQWNSLATQLNVISLRACFEAVSQLFERIEESAWLSPWGRTSC
jgi:hypothetical protein